MIVRAGDGVVGMTAICRVHDGTHAAGVFFRGRVGEGFAVGVLRVPDFLRHAVLEADHVVLPVAWRVR